MQGGGAFVAHVVVVAVLCGKRPLRARCIAPARCRGETEQARRDDHRHYLTTHLQLKFSQSPEPHSLSRVQALLQNSFAEHLWLMQTLVFGSQQSASALQSSPTFWQSV